MPPIDPIIIPKVSTIKGDPQVFADLIAEEHLQRVLSLQVLNNAGIDPPGFIELGHGWLLVDNHKRSEAWAKEQDELMRQYIKPPKWDPTAPAGPFTDQCEYCGRALRSGAPCSKPGCKGQGRGK